MFELPIYNICVFSMFILAALTFLALTKVTAPYGRHERSGWGPRIPNKFGWVLMELPAILAFFIFYFQGKNSFEAVPLIFFFLWQLHYFYRTFVFPFLTRTEGKKMPLLIALIGALINTFNAFINARWISHYGSYSIEWVHSTPFAWGVGLFLIGLLINGHSDSILIKLRTHGPKEYKIPYGGCYRFISCPNYLGEILEWTGWALATYSLGGLAFALYTLASLLPRAIDNHKWYKARFPDYPNRRKAIFPFLF